MIDPTERLKLRIERERSARKEAERLLEEKSLELFQLNKSLLDINDELESRVEQRTQQLLLANESLRTENDRRAKTEEELRSSKTKAEAANLAKTQFLANMSHEIRTPLNGIIGFSDLLIENFKNPIESPEVSQQWLNTIHSAGNHLLSLINHILDLSKIEAGCLELEKKSFNPEKTIQEVLSVFTLQAKSKGVQLEVFIDASVEQAIVSDAVRMRQILFNLLSNALKFTNQGKVTLKAGLILEEEPTLKISVQDNGIGIPQEKLEKIFDPFTQADASTTRKYGGTGLGLTISRQFARLMGGDLIAESEIGKGSTFHLSIKAPLCTKSQTEKKARANTKDIEIQKGLNVLIVDDVEMNRTLMKAILKKISANCSTCENGKEAVAYVEKNQPDLILMDNQMPVMGGLEATSKIRELGLETPIITLTAGAMEEDRDISLEHGSTDFLTKPINSEKLFQAIQRILST